MAEGPILVTATFAPGDDGWLQALRRAHYPAERNLVPAHLTLFRLLPPGAEGELGRRLAAAVKAPRPRATIAGPIDLGGGTALRVESAALEAIRDALASALHGLLTPQDQAAWRPHVTIQNKVSPGVARHLQDSLRGRHDGRPLVLDGLASWRYLRGPWRRIRLYPFRG
jgi:hypothetical protein